MTRAGLWFRGACVAVIALGGYLQSWSAGMTMTDTVRWFGGGLVVLGVSLRAFVDKSPAEVKP